MWHILCDMRPYPLNKQENIIGATTILHNFILICCVEDEEFNKYDHIPEYSTDCEGGINTNEEVSSYSSRVLDRGNMDRVRNQITVAY